MDAPVSATRTRSPGRGRETGCALLLVALLVVALTWPAIDAGVRLALLIPEVVPSLPVRPLLWISTHPERREVRYPGADRLVTADLYLPAPGGRHGAVLLFLGVNPIGRDEPILVRTAEGLARTGLVVLVPVSERLGHGEISPAEVDDLVAGIQFLRAHPSVAADRVGLTGFSVGGSLALLAAADPRIASDLAFVNAFGAYADAGDLAAEVVARAYELDGRTVPWQPAPMAEGVVIDQITRMVADPDERAAIRDLVRARRPDRAVENVEPGAGSSDVRTAEGRAVLAFLSSASLPEARARLAQLPPAGLAQLQAVSPLPAMPRLRTRVFLMHDDGDPLVPFVGSRRLAAAAPRDRIVLSEFSLFDHVEPTRAVDVATLAREVVELYIHLYRVLLPVL